MNLSGGKVTKVLIVEDHLLVADGIINLLSRLPQYEVVGLVSDGLEVYAECQKHMPDLVLLDLGLPGMDGLDVLARLKQRWPEIKIIVITAQTAEYKASAAFDAGALGYVLKNSLPQTLLAGMQCAVVGRHFLDPALEREQVSGQEKLAHQALTQRQRQVLKLAAEGRRNQEIADHLSVSLKTVETHRLHLMRKLDAHHVGDLIHWARRLGLIL